MVEVRAVTVVGVLMGLAGLVGLSHATDRWFAGGAPIDCALRAGFSVALAAAGYGLVRRAPWAIRVYAGTAIALVAVLSADGLVAGDGPVEVLAGAVLLAAALVAVGAFLAAALRRERASRPGTGGPGE